VRIEPDETTVNAAANGLTWALHRQSATGVLYGLDHREIARTVAYQVLNAGQVTERRTWQSTLTTERAETEWCRRAYADAVVELDRWKRAHATAAAEHDHVLTRVQTALAAMEDRALAERLAHECGVLLPSEESA